MIFQSKYKKLGLFILFIVILIVGYKSINIIRDSLTLQYVKEETSWLENYYTINAHYPNENKFAEQFSKNKLLMDAITYIPVRGVLDNNSEQNFSLKYKLSKEISSAIGSPRIEMFGYSGYYIVRSCERIIPNFVLNSFITDEYIYPPAGTIYTDIYSGEVYFSHSGQSDVKIPLLSGLDKPRIYSWINNSLSNFDPGDLSTNVKYKDKVFITNGSDIYSYDWDSTNLKLINSHKIGEIPQNCSTDLTLSDKTNTESESNNVIDNISGSIESNSSPIVNKENMINDKGQVVDKFIKGNFKVIGTNETFNYQERFNPNQGDKIDYNDNAVNDCVTKNCSIVYFKNEKNNEQKRISLFNNYDNLLTGRVVEIYFLSDMKSRIFLQEPLPHKRDDSVVYHIEQTGNDKQIIKANKDLCVNYQGGDFNCNSPRFKVGDLVTKFGLENSIFLTSDLIQTQLLSYQYFTTPDTGEVFPIVYR
ncbi:MAG: hypothetical protein JJE53_01095 [Candidatus Pacebacteria bacterium]|nr:hypothetical protein [Candidatus Paceibacterota bacterium]